MNSTFIALGRSIAFCIFLILLSCTPEFEGKTSHSSPTEPVNTSTATAPTDAAGQTATFQEQMEAQVTGNQSPNLAFRSVSNPMAPELTGLTGWINSEPLSIMEQQGSIILIDFWTYTCINCIRTLPYLEEWHKKYVDRGLIIIGIHTPEFEFEKDPENVRIAVSKFGLNYPIAQDNTYLTWNAFDNRFWPAKYLIDKDGYIRYSHFGEGAYAETESQIKQLLTEAGSLVDDIPSDDKQDPKMDPQAYTNTTASNLTRELYLGFQRNKSTALRGGVPYVGHQEYYEAANVERLYQLPMERNNHFVYLQGAWKTGYENLTHAHDTNNLEDSIVVPFNASNVNVVLGAKQGEQYKVELKLDKNPITKTQAGSDVMWGKNGESYILVDESRMYNLIESSSFIKHELALSSNSSSFAVFAFTFGGYVEES